MLKNLNNLNENWEYNEWPDVDLDGNIISNQKTVKPLALQEKLCGKKSKKAVKEEVCPDCGKKVCECDKLNGASDNATADADISKKSYTAADKIQAARAKAAQTGKGNDKLNEATEDSDTDLFDEVQKVLDPIFCPEDAEDDECVPVEEVADILLQYIGDEGAEYLKSKLCPECEDEDKAELEEPEEELIECGDGSCTNCDEEQLNEKRGGGNAASKIKSIVNSWLKEDVDCDSEVAAVNAVNDKSALYHNVGQLINSWGDNYTPEYTKPHHISPAINKACKVELPDTIAYNAKRAAANSINKHMKSWEDGASTGSASDHINKSIRAWDDNTNWLEEDVDAYSEDDFIDDSFIDDEPRRATGSGNAEAKIKATIASWAR